MYRHLYASELAGSDATTANLLPTTTRTHNQPQHQFPPDTIPAVALQNQNRRDDPHLAGSEACLCSSCHLRDNFFPRSQDGRIVLPHPSSFIHSARLSRPTATTTSASAPLATPGLVKRNRIESDIVKLNEGRYAGGSKTPHLQNDKGEGSSTGAGRMSGNIGENWVTLPHRRSSREIILTEESQHTPQMSMSMQSKPEGRSFSGPSRRTQRSKKYNKKPKRPDPWPRILGSSEFAGQSSHHLVQQSSQHSQLLDKSHRPRLESQARELTLSLQKARSATPSAAAQSQCHIGGYDYEHRPVPSPHHGEFGLSMSMTISSYPEPPGRPETSHHHHHLHHDSASRPESATDTVHVAQDEPKFIRLSSQPTSGPLDTTTSTERSVNSSPTRDPPQPSSSSSQQFEGGGGGSSSSSNLQTQFRFQEPVVSEAHIISPIRPRELSIVQVKWDSERKRRQGYFAQEEGSEKSRFRHYNKANCDFES